MPVCSAAMAIPFSTTMVRKAGTRKKQVTAISTSTTAPNGTPTTASGIFHNNLLTFNYQLSIINLLEALLNTEFQTVQSGCELVGKQVTQFAGEDDDVIGMFLVITVYRIVVEIRGAAITQ